MSKKIFLLVLMLVTLCSNAQWSNNATENTVIANRNVTEFQSQLVHHTNGDTYIAWIADEGDNYSVRLQILDHLGNKKLDNQGLLVSSYPAISGTTRYSLLVDTAGNAIITFHAYQGEEAVVNAIKISSSGNFLWGNTGKQISQNLPGEHYAPQAIITQDNNIVITWSYFATDGSSILCLTKLKPDGSFFWNDSVKQLKYQGAGNKVFKNQELLAAGGDSFILHYSIMSPMAYASDRKLLARKYDTNGVQIWETTICDQEGMPSFTPVFLKEDTSGGLIISWSDDRDKNMLADAYLQHLNSNGTSLLQLNGMKVALGENGNHFYPQFDYSQSTHEYFVQWKETKVSQDIVGLFAQKISQNGERLWGNDGKEIIPFVNLRTVSPGYTTALPDGNAMLFYSISDSGNTLFSTLRCTKIDATGNFVWSNKSKAICSLSSFKSYINIATNNDNKNWILSWSDERNEASYKDVYVQNINVNGVLGQDIASSIQDQSYSEKNGMELIGNYPNPFNPETTISFNLTNASAVALTVYNNKGEQVQQLVNSSLSAGLHSIKFNAAGLNSGVYFYKLTSNGINQTQKMLLCK